MSSQILQRPNASSTHLLVCCSHCCLSSYCCYDSPPPLLLVYRLLLLSSPPLLVWCYRYSRIDAIVAAFACLLCSLSSSHNRSSFPPQLSATTHNNSGFLLLLIWQIYTASSFSERMIDGRLLVGSCQHRCCMYITVRFTYNLVLVLYITVL